MIFNKKIPLIDIQSYRSLATIIIVSLSMFFGQKSFAQNDMSMLTNAANAYSTQDYQMAIDLYEQILASGRDAFEIYYNLGNAYFKDNQIAPAILNYERAARIDPADPDLQYNLAIAQGQTVDKIEMIAIPEFVTGYKSMVNKLTADQWGVFSLISFLLLLASMMGFLFLNKRLTKQILLSAGGLFLLLTLLFFYFGWQQQRWLNDKKEAIIFQPTITVTSTPDRVGEELFVLHEGTKVKIVERFQDWVRIQIGDGNTGWVPKGAAEEI